MYCKTCGKEVNDNAVVCPHCGCETGKVRETGQDASSMGFAILSFFIPLLGLILYLIWKQEYPLRAKSAGKGALIGVIVSLVIGVIYAIVIGALIGSIVSTPYYEYSYYYSYY